MKRLNIVLDLDNTLISSVPLGKTQKCRLPFRDLKPDYRIYERPHLQPFLSWLFDNFNVGVWTAASRSYATFVVDEFILRKNRKLDFILYDKHCNQSNDTFGALKKLRLLERIGIDYSIKDTLIVDDNPEVYSAQPNNCISVIPFDMEKNPCLSFDDELLHVKRKILAFKLLK